MHYVYNVLILYVSCIVHTLERGWTLVLAEDKQFQFQIEPIYLIKTIRNGCFTIVIISDVVKATDGNTWFVAKFE
jgi:hypothetical protein